MAFEPYVDERGKVVDEREHKRREKWQAQFTPEERAERASRLAELESIIWNAGHRGPGALRPRDAAERAAILAAYVPKPKPTTYVYFLRAAESGRIKIGKTVNVQKRLASLRGASSGALELLGYVAESAGCTERDLHARFSESRTHGEWFEPTDELLAFIREAVTNG